MCTGIQLRTTKGAPIYGRTMEFANHLESEVLVIKQGTEFTGTGPTSKPNTGAQWTARYAMTGLNADNLDRIIDGINSVGLCIGAFFFKDYAGYQDVPFNEGYRSICSVDLPTYLLSLCATVDEVKTQLGKILVNKGAPTPENNNFVVAQNPFPLHYNIHDAQGNAIVVEYINGILHIHDNTLGVLTNAPEFNWHTTNLKNYVNLTPTDVIEWDLTNTSHPHDQVQITPTGQGSGFLGLPGDYTPPSRFVRAVAYSQYSAVVETHQETVLQAFHILDNFDIPKGTVIQTNPVTPSAIEYTQWTVASDLTERKFYFHTFSDRTIRLVDLANWEFGSKNITKIFVGQGPTIINLADQSHATADIAI
jgi:choloylglycine hydrolase